MFHKKDLLIILPFLAAAAALLLWFRLQPTSGGIAVVEKDGVEICRIDLSKQTTTQILNIGGDMHIQLKVEPGTISFYHSDCPDQICVRTGKLTKPGQTAVCLPGKVSVRIVKRSGNEKYDGYTGWLQ
jgi:hypothetical protein